MSFYFGNTSLRVILGDLFVMPCWSQVCAGLLLKICKGNPNLPRLQIQKPELNNNSVCFFDGRTKFGSKRSPKTRSRPPASRGPCVGRWRVIPTALGSWNRLGSFATGGLASTDSWGYLDEIWHSWDEYGWIWMKKATRTSHQLGSNERIAQYCAAFGIPHATWTQQKLWMPMNHCRRQAATWPPWNRSSSSCCAAKMRCSERKGPPVGNMVIQWMMWMEWSFFSSKEV